MSLQKSRKIDITWAVHCAVNFFKTICFEIIRSIWRLISQQMARETFLKPEKVFSATV